MEKTRTEKVILNSSITFTCQIVYLIVSFVCRTIFTKMLNVEYLGISGLFSNILTILNFAELGIGSALVYRMYEPLAKKDYVKVRLYMQLYKTVYCWILVVIGIVGIILIPAIPSLVSAPNVKENLILLYILYLCQTLVTYVFTYKKSILIADQKSYLVNLYEQIFNIFMNIAQCIFLIITHNFVVYCMLNIVFNLFNNIACSYRADKEYPFLRRNIQGKLSKTGKLDLVKDVKGLMLRKIAETAFSGTDNIFISVFIGINYVGILSNYTLFSGIVNGIMNKIFGSVTASMGNLVVIEDKSKTEEILKKMFFLNTSMYGYFCLGMLVLLREFVTTIWLDTRYDFSQMIIIFILVELFFRSIHYPLYMTRTAMGCFSEYKLLFAGASVLNILLDFLWVRSLGIVGLYLATILCRGITYIVDIWVVYKIQLNRPIWKYLSLVIKWLIFLAVTGAIMVKIVAFIPYMGIGGFIIKGTVVSSIYFLVYFVTFSRSEEFTYYRKLVIQLFNKRQ